MFGARKTARGDYINPMAGYTQQDTPRPSPQGALFGSKKKSGGNEILGMILGAIGDGFTNWSGGQGTFVPSMMRQRLMEQEAQQQQQMAAQQREAFIQAAQNVGVGREQAIAQAMGVKVPEAPEPPKPGSFEWYQTATPEQRATYDEYNPVVVSTGRGPVAVPRNRPAIGTTRQSTRSIANTPAPQVGANGFPATLTRQQYQAVVAEMGQAATDEWARRNNIRIGN